MNASLRERIERLKQARVEGTPEPISTQDYRKLLVTLTLAWNLSKGELEAQIDFENSLMCLFPELKSKVKRGHSFSVLPLTSEEAGMFPRIIRNNLLLTYSRASMVNIDSLTTEDRKELKDLILTLAKNFSREFSK